MLKKGKYFYLEILEGSNKAQTRKKKKGKNHMGNFRESPNWTNFFPLERYNDGFL